MTKQTKLAVRLPKVEDHPIFAEVAKAYDDCGPLDGRFHRGEGDTTLSDEDRFEALADLSMEVRNLGFRASKPVTPKIAAAIMKQLVDGYNEFSWRQLLLLPSDCKVTLAREGSVCIYVQPGKTKLPTRGKLKASEYDLLKRTVYDSDPMHSGTYSKHRPTPYGGFEGEVRIWWD